MAAYRLYCGKDVGGSFQLSLCQELDLRHVHFNVKERKEENPFDLIEHSSSSHGIHFYVFVLFKRLWFTVGRAQYP